MPGSQMTIADFAAALDAKRAELATVNGKIEGLEAERRRVTLAQPHTDDIAATFLRGLDAASNNFKRQFAARLADTYVGPDSAGAVAQDKAPNLLTLDAEKLDNEARLSRVIQNKGPELNIAALTYFFRSQIAAEIPALVDRLCPAGQQGMKKVDRENALQEIKAQLATLGVERDRLQADLGAARAAVNRRGTE